MRAAALALLLGAPAAAQDGAALRPGLWESRGAGVRTVGCGPEMGPLLQRFGATLQGAPRLTLRDWAGGFEPAVITARMGEAVAAEWSEPEPGRHVGTLSARREGAAPLPFGSVDIRLRPPEATETHTLVDATALRALEGKPVEPGTEGCTLILRSLLTYRGQPEAVAPAE